MDSTLIENLSKLKFRTELFISRDFIIIVFKLTNLRHFNESIFDGPKTWAVRWFRSLMWYLTTFKAFREFRILFYLKWKIFCIFKKIRLCQKNLTISKSYRDFNLTFQSYNTKFCLLQGDWLSVSQTLIEFKPILFRNSSSAKIMVF